MQNKNFQDLNVGVLDIHIMKMTMQLVSYQKNTTRHTQYDKDCMLHTTYIAHCFLKIKAVHETLHTKTAK